MAELPDISHFKTMADTYDANEDVQKGSKDALKALLDNNLLRKDDHLLDFGCGPGGFTSAMAQHVASVVGVDITHEMIEVAQRTKSHVTNAKFIQGEVTDATDPAWIGAPFDIIVSMMAFHHVPDVAGTLANLARFLRPGGRLVLIDLLSTPESQSFHPPEKQASVVTHGFEADRIKRDFASAGLIDITVTTPFRMRRVAQHQGIGHAHGPSGDGHDGHGHGGHCGHGHGHGPARGHGNDCHAHGGHGGHGNEAGDGHGHGNGSPRVIPEHPVLFAVGYAPST